MHVVQSAFHVGKRSVKHLLAREFEDRVLFVQVTNGTESTLQVVGEPYLRAGVCELSFRELEPGQTGKIHFSSSQGTWGSAAVSGCHHAGAIEFSLGEQRLLLGQTNPIGHRLGKQNKFALEFDQPSLKSRPRTLETFYSQLPQDFIGDPGSHSCVSGKDVTARTTVMQCEGSRIELDVVLSCANSVQVEFELESLQQLKFLEWCAEYLDGYPSIAGVFFLAEFGAVTKALFTKKLSLADKAFTLDLLIYTFVLDNVFFSLEALKMNFQHWADLRERWGDDFRTLQGGKCTTLAYHAYAKVDATPSDWEAWIDAAKLLLRAAAWQCKPIVDDAVDACKSAGAWPTLTPMLYSEQKRNSGARDSIAVNADVLLEHLRKCSITYSHCEEEEMTASMSHNSTSSEMTSSVSEGYSRCESETAGRTEITSNSLLYVLVRHCIHSSADYGRRRWLLLDTLQELQPSDEGRAKLQYYREWLPLSRRQFVTLEGNGIPEVEFETSCMEVLGNLDGRGQTSFKEYVESMGHGSADFKGMTTNSKSGEIFIFSGDRKFIIKTVSAKEYDLLSRFMPAYQNHLRYLPNSLIVRFAGLFRVRVPGSMSKYFIVMRSIFNPVYPIHVTYDLKGSTHNRKKKAGEGIEKDEDWITSGIRLALPAKTRREICAVHEADAYLLTRFRMMDYSLLIGIHNGGVDPHIAEESNQGFQSECGGSLYFIGLIDFSIKYSLKKQTETLFNVAKGSGDNASCVSEDAYAIRQVRFMRDRIFKPVAPGNDMGTLGILRVNVIQGHNLVAADLIGTSDPYVKVILGLVSATTHAIPKTLNPTWNELLVMPVNEIHKSMNLLFTVWDENHGKALRGDDNFLGKLKVPMSSIMESRELDLRLAPLLEIERGKLTVNLQYEALPVDSLESLDSFIGES